MIEELIELANRICKQKAEEQTIELKAAQTGCPKGLYDTLSSFSNQDSGGILVFGIDENAAFQVVGVYDPQDLQKKITEQCLQMEPPVRAVFTLAEYQGKTICAAEIPAVKKRNAKLFLQRGDLFGEVGLRVEKLAGSFGEILFAGGGNEII